MTLKDIDKSTLYPNAAKDAHGSLLVAAATGTGDKGFERATLLVDAGVDVLVVDTAHGHAQGVIDQVYRLRHSFPDTEIIGGNIATPEAAKALIAAGQMR